MMKEQTRTKTRTYRYNRRYSVDIVETQQTREAWLYDNKVAHKLFMFGFPKKRHDYDLFIEIVETNIPEYIEDLKEDIESLEEYHTNKEFYERS